MNGGGANTKIQAEPIWDGFEFYFHIFVEDRDGKRGLFRVLSLSLEKIKIVTNSPICHA